MKQEPRVPGALALRAPGELIEHLVDLAIDATGADRAALFLIDDDAGVLVSHLARERGPQGLGAGRAPGWPLPREASRLVDDALTFGEPETLQDTRASWMFPDAWREAVAPGAALLVPLGGTREALGLLLLGWNVPQTIPASVQASGARAATTLGMTLEAAVTAEFERSLSVERERVLDGLREPLARTLSAMNLKAGLLRLVLDDELAGDAAELETLARRGLTVLRRADAGLTALRSDGADLRSALIDLGRDFEARHPVEVTLRIDDVDLLSRPVQDALLVAATEGLSNVERHAEAARVEVSVTVESGNAVLRIADDGLGLMGGASASTGLGLELIRRALEPLGGRVELRDRESGAELVASAPVSAELPTNR